MHLDDFESRCSDAPIVVRTHNAQATLLNAAHIIGIGLYADLNSVDGPTLCYGGGDIRNCNKCFAGQPEHQRFRLQKLQFDEAFP